jgi:hypothetical protein
VATLIVGWAFMAAFYVVFIHGYSSPDPARAAGWTYRKEVAGSYGLLPPSSEPIGLLLWAATIGGFVAAIAFFAFGDRFVGASNATMISSFLLTLWRDDKWLKQQPGYQAAVKAAKDDAAS